MDIELAAVSSPAPHPVRLELLVSATDDSVVVVELDAQPGNAWIEDLQKRLRKTPGLEATIVRQEGSTLYLVGSGRGETAAAPLRVAKVIAQVGG